MDGGIDSDMGIHINGGTVVATGNMLDRTAYKDFLSNNNLTSGIIVSDKGIPASAAEDWVNKHEEPSYIIDDLTDDFIVNIGKPSPATTTTC